MALQQPVLGKVFAEDVHNMVLDYCADGVDAFLGCVGPALASAGGSKQDETLLAEGSQRLYDSLATKASSSLQLFEQLCCTTVFQAPLGPGMPQVAPVSLPSEDGFGFASDESEEDLMARIASMRQQLREVDKRCSSLHQELERVDTEMASYGDTSSFQAAASISVANRDAIAAISEAAGKLQEIMGKAAQLRCGTRQDHDQTRQTDGSFRSMAAVGAFASVV